MVEVKQSFRALETCRAIRWGGQALNVPEDVSNAGFREGRSMMMTRRVLGVLITMTALVGSAAGDVNAEQAADAARVTSDISYLPPSAPERDDAYAAARCKLDLYLPAKKPDGGFP